MKKFLTTLLALALVAALVVFAGWYMTEYDPATVQDFLISQARHSAQAGNFAAVKWFYDLSCSLSGDNQNVSIALADIYKSVGNYTKAEYTLVNAIAQGGNAELYMALCKTYVEQDKLLDAVNMLERIADPEIKAQLDAQRPQVPTADFAPGLYTQYITLTFQYQGGSLYVTTDGEYPSKEAPAYSQPLALSRGDNKVYALVVADNGLVSPLSVLNYTIGGVVEDVVLEDAAVDAAIRELLMFGADTVISTSDLWEITEFTVPAEAQTLNDLSHLIYLQELTIADRTIQDLSFLSELRQLRSLTVERCRIETSLEAFASLNALESLALRSCRLSSVAELEQLQTVTRLDLSNNAIGNLAPLVNLRNLTELDLSNNAVTDLNQLSHITGLTKLNLAHNAVTSMAPLAFCPNLTQLDLSYNQLTDISAVSHLNLLQSFSASNNQLTDISDLRSCPELKKLDVSFNALTDLSALSGLVELTELNFSNNGVTALPSLPRDCDLVIIDGSHNALTDIRILGGMERLNYIYMDYNPFSEVGFLADCPQLIQINVYATNVSAEAANDLINRSIIVNFNPVDS